MLLITWKAPGRFILMEKVLVEGRSSRAPSRGDVQQRPNTVITRGGGWMGLGTTWAREGSLFRSLVVERDEI